LAAAENFGLKHTLMCHITTFPVLGLGLTTLCFFEIPFANYQKMLGQWHYFNRLYWVYIPNPPARLTNLFHPTPHILKPLSA
jgi:hypothetical protein